MIVARSAALAAEARSPTMSSATDAPSAASTSSPGALSPASPAACPRPCPRSCPETGLASIRQTWSRVLSRSRSPATIASCAAVSTKMALAPESLMIHSTWSAEDVS